eukprot:TRINITY_DN12667_c0_g1_i2.p1 TRINITY_DN12667_c0_g1~~TRINITY_DN12667_c0_g1_i2.p1  ORF type:complete len:275 (-),score=25.57 TRINITY_DN12667_c0_g1_i2:74-898(-)
MGQRIGKDCVCTEDCQFQPWRDDPNVTVTTLGALKKESKRNTLDRAIEPTEHERNDAVPLPKYHAMAVPPPRGPIPPLGKVFSFSVSLDKDGGDSFGLAHVPLEDVTSCLLIVDFRDQGPVARWNAERDRLGTPDFKIRRGDRIVAVGSERDLDRMRMLLTEETAQCTVERWPESTGVRLKKEFRDDTIGIQTDLIERADGGEALIVTGVIQGYMADWNSWAITNRYYHAVISPGYEVCCVNGVTGPARRLQHFLEVGNELEIHFRRPPVEAYQ